MRLSELLEGITPLPDPFTEKKITGITCHTDGITPGTLWICIPGHRFFPISLLSLAEKRGAAAAVIPAGIPVPLPVSFPLIPSENIRRDTALLFQKFHGFPDRGLRLFGVTGTNGKTTVSSMLAHLLQVGGISCGWIGTVGATLNGAPFAETETMTTPPPEKLFPLLAAMKKAGAKAVVLEVSSQALAQERVSPLSFEAGIFTNLSREHLDYHATMEEYAAAKSRLFGRCGKAIYLNEDPHGASICGAAPLFPCGAGTPFRLVYRKGSEETAKLHFPTGEWRLSLAMEGEYNQTNALLAATAAFHAGISAECILRGLASFPGVRGRMEKIPLSPWGIPATVVIDYAHTPEALRRTLTALRKVTAGRLLLLFGCGGERDTGKRAPMGCIAAELADFTYITSDNSRSESPLCIIRDILSGMPENGQYRVMAQRASAIQAALSELGEGDTLLLAGKGHETYEIDGKGIHPFDEREIVFSFLENRKKGNTVQGGIYADPH